MITDGRTLVVAADGGRARATAWRAVSRASFGATDRAVFDLIRLREVLS